MIKIIKEVSKKDLEEWLYTIDEEDKNLYLEVNNPNKIGIFQINGASAERLNNELHPDNFDEIVACNGLARPGPIDTSAPLYIQRKRGEKSPYPEQLNEILKDTYSTFIFQEQIMETFHKIGGFTLQEADGVRGLMKKMSKLEKDPEDVKKWNKAVKKFIGGAIKLGITETEASKIADDMNSFSGYSFCLAHSTSYGYIALITLYLSFYFRKYFYSSVLTYEVDREKYLLQRLNSVKRQGLEILPPDINKSKIHFAPEEDKIRFGLSDIKFVSETAANIILENRPYNTIADFIIRTRSRNINSRVLEALISSGAFDGIYSGRKKLLMIVSNFWEKKKSTKVEEKIIGLLNEAINQIESIPALEDAAVDLAEFEKKYFGFKFFSSSFTKEKLIIINELKEKKLIYYDLDEVGVNSRKVPLMINSIRLHTDKNGKEMSFITAEDVNGRTESIPVFASYWEYLKDVIKTDALFLLNVYKSDYNDKLTFGQTKWTTSELVIRRLAKEI